MNLSQWIDVATAAFTALAAFGALGAVWHATRVWRHSLRPELHGQVVTVPKTPTSRQLQLVLHNAGPRVAKGPMFVVVGDCGEYVAGVVDSGFLHPGETVVVETQLEAGEAESHSRGVMACRDTEETSWAWDFTGKRKRVARWQPPWWLRWLPTPQPTSLTEMVRLFDPDLDLETLRQVPYRVTPRG